MNEIRKNCKECPWIIKTNHNDNMISNIERLVNNGSLNTRLHRCHMIDTNIWANANNKNVCIGSLNKQTTNKQQTNKN